MVVYWDAVVLFNVVIDYLLLFAASRLCGWNGSRTRLAAAAMIGGVGAIIMLLLPSVSFLFAVIPISMCVVAYSGSGKSLRLSLLFLLCCCALAGMVLLLGQVLGRSARLTRAIFAADLPWSVFFAAGLVSYGLLCLVFRAAARRDAADFADAVIRCGSDEVHLRLLCDTGNGLRDPVSGKGVPVVEKQALAAIRLPRERERIAYRALGVENGTLEAFRCDGLRLNGRELGGRLIAISPMTFSECCGLWCAGEEESCDT